MVVAAIFRGDRAQVRALMLAVEHNCSCEISPEGLVSGNCFAHQALLDQRFLDGCLFARWMHERLEAEEGDVKEPPPPLSR